MGRLRYPPTPTSASHPPPSLSENEGRAGKFDGNYLAVSPYNAEAGDGWDGELLLSLNSEGQAAQTHSSQGALGLAWGWVRGLGLVGVGQQNNSRRNEVSCHIFFFFIWSTF